MNHIITVNALSKIYKRGWNKKSITALENVSLQVEQSTIFGLIGQNGAGKTTLIKILLGLVLPNSGTFSLLNKNMNDNLVRKHIGYLPESHRFPPFLKGVQFLKWFGKMNGLSGVELQKRIDYVLEIVKMKERSNEKLKTYSKGMLQRIGLAQALINNPQFLFLDEPTDGVDPVGRKEIRDLLLQLKHEGKTIFLNSHILSEVELITDNVAILDKGKVIYSGNLSYLTSENLQGYAEKYKLKIDGDFASVIDNSIQEKFSITDEGNGILIVNVKQGEDINTLIDSLRAKGIRILSFDSVKHSLEEQFISLLKRGSE